MQKLILRACALIPLLAATSCQHAGQLAMTDLANAAQIVAKGGDPQGQACWLALSPAADAVETAPKPGFASLIEADRLFVFATQGPSAPCNGVGGLILSMLLQKAVPFLP